jgi:hypothetical protein
MRGLVLATRIKDSAKGGGGQRARAPEPKPAEKPITTPWAAGSEPPPAYY